MTASNDETPLLRAEGITKTFPGVRALDGVEIEVRRGRLTALLGENGAGKSTLMNVLSGVFPASDGTIRIDGREVVFSGTKHAQELGIGIVHQELNLFPHLTVAENIFLGAEPLGPIGLVDFRELNRRAAALLSRLRLEIDPRTPLGELRVGQRQMIEIAKVLSHAPRIVIMDEPTSALSEAEVETLFSVIRDLKADGVGIIYITHRLDELYKIGDDFAVFRDGRFVNSGRLADFTRDQLVAQMVGRDLGALSRPEKKTAGEEVLRVENLRLGTAGERPLLDDISFALAKGEVLGVFGLIGAGRSELLETVFGLHPRNSSMKLFIDGAEARRPSAPRDAIAAGLAFVPEDRRKEGLVLTMSVAANASLASLQTCERFGVVSERREATSVGTYVERLRVKTASLATPVRNLSGGNQQKVILAKWLATAPKVLLLDEPTRGIDVNAKREIYELIRELTSTGLGVVMVSSELPEILALSDRVLVMCEGRVTAEFSANAATEEAIMRAALPRSERD